MTVTDIFAHQLCLSCQEILEHDDALQHGTMLIKLAPVTTTPIFLGDEFSFHSIPSEQLDAIEECVFVTLANIITNNESVGKAYGSVVGVVGQSRRLSCYQRVRVELFLR